MTANNSATSSHPSFPDSFMTTTTSAGSRWLANIRYSHFCMTTKHKIRRGSHMQTPPSREY